MTDAELSVMTFNIRRRLPTWRPADRWERRRDRVRALLQRERPMLLGVQEALPDQARWVGESLGDDAYRSVGGGRDARGGGEACPVYVDTARLEILGWRQSALSDSPDAPGSASWGNVIPRVAVTLDLRDRLTGSRLRFVNTHLDHVSARSRERSAVRLRELATGGSGAGIVVGDFNTGPDSAAAAALAGDGALYDAWRSARIRASGERRTFANYRAPRPGRRIDLIFATPDVEVSRIAILDEPVLGGWASDHLPVAATVVIPEEGAA